MKLSRFSLVRDERIGNFVVAVLFSFTAYAPEKTNGFTQIKQHMDFRASTVMIIENLSMTSKKEKPKFIL